MKKSFVLSFICASIILFFGCTRNQDPLPIVKTGDVFMHNFNYYTASGLVDANGALVAHCGICYSTTNKKPDVSGPHTDMSKYPSEQSQPHLDEWGCYYTLHHDLYTGIQPILGNLYLNDVGSDYTIYVRAYAVTLGGEVVYGKTVEYKVTMSDNNNLAVLLSRPAHWNRVSISPNTYNTSFEKIVTFNRDGSLYFDEDGQNYYWYCQDFYWFIDIDEDYLNDFCSGTSSNFHPDLSKIKLLYCRGINSHIDWIEKNSILDLSTSELKLSRMKSVEHEQTPTGEYDEVIITFSPVQ